MQFAVAEADAGDQPHAGHGETSQTPTDGAAVAGKGGLQEPAYGARKVRLVLHCMR